MMTLMEQLKKRMSELGDAKGIIILESETIQGLINEFDALVDELEENKTQKRILESQVTLLKSIL